MESVWVGKTWYVVGTPSPWVSASPSPHLCPPLSIGFHTRLWQVHVLLSFLPFAHLFKPFFLTNSLVSDCSSVLGAPRRHTASSLSPRLVHLWTCEVVDYQKSLPWSGSREHICMCGCQAVQAGDGVLWRMSHNNRTANKMMRYGACLPYMVFFMMVDVSVCYLALSLYFLFLMPAAK